MGGPVEKSFEEYAKEAPVETPVNTAEGSDSVPPVTTDAPSGDQEEV